MEKIVLYHANCHDGFGAACAVKMNKAYADATFIPVHYGDVKVENNKLHVRDLNPGELSNLDLVVVDFSLPMVDTAILAEECASFIWLDHHKTAFEMWLGPEHSGSYTMLDETPDRQMVIGLHMHKSGAMLAWEYFHPNTPTPRLILDIQDRDLWVFHRENSKAVHEALSLYGYSFESWIGLMTYPDAYDFLVTKGQVLVQAMEKRVESALYKSVRTITLINVDGANQEFVSQNALNDISEIGNALCKATGFPSCTFFIKDNDVICSLRSLRDFDVSAFAKNYGGGGHKNAAGFKMPIETFFTTVWRTI